MEDETVQELYSPDQTKRVVIYRRETGTFYYEVERFSDEPRVMSWLPFNQCPIGFYDSQEIAVKVASDTLNWLNPDAA